MSSHSQYLMPNTGTFVRLAAPESADAPRYRKEIVRAGQYTHPELGELDFSLDTLDRWVREFRERQALEWEHRVYYGHMAGNWGAVGFVEAIEVENNALFATMTITDPDRAAEIDRGHMRHTSPGIGVLEDEHGRRWDGTLIEISLVAEPHLRQQGPFIRLEAHNPTQKPRSNMNAEETLRSELEATKAELAELRAAQEVDENAAKLQGELEEAQNKLKAAEARVAEMESAALEADIAGRVSTLLAKHQLTDAEAEKLKPRLVKLAAVDPELVDEHLAAYADRPAAPTAPRTSLAAGNQNDKVQKAIELAAERTGTTPESFIETFGDQANLAAWNYIHPGEEFPADNPGGE